MEMEAVRALAGFSQTAGLESEAVRRRSRRWLRKRLENGCPARDLEDCSQSRDLLLFPDDNEEEKIAIQEKIGDQHISETSTIDDFCTTSLLCRSGHKPRQNLTEAEKEARRMRRVLANRESARQTIRRRQALRDDLTKKVAVLSLDNQSMRLEKEGIMKQYRSLKRRNNQLKAELAKEVARPSKDGHTGERVSPAPPLMPVAWTPWPATAAQEWLRGEAAARCEPFCWPPCVCSCSLLHQTPKSYQLASEKRDDREVDFGAGCSMQKVLPLIDKASDEKPTGRLDIDLNKRASSDALLPCSTVDEELSRDESADKHATEAEASRMAAGHRTAKSLDVSARAAAARRRRAIKLKQLCGGTILLRN
ncbi:hypothetical protein HPP92_008813 [Vanilla planifolia]|uniref:BZIP domain-containing protein n=1 Tax=Vanilla planifolia TaxID=51239 RepID=A0A835RAB7_VANPL|nr:hypothetical protein HPP92_008813 [Vanilla planifolia]